MLDTIINADGKIEQSDVGKFVTQIENKVSNLTLMANISTVVIEMCQNIMNYSKSKDLLDDTIDPTGSIVVEKDQHNSYHITSSNIVSLADKEKIEPKLIEIESLDKAGIKKRYKELRRSGKNTHEKGGGIGTYEIAKISDSVSYNFEQINEDRFIYSLKVILKSKSIKTDENKTILLMCNDDMLRSRIEIINSALNYNIVYIDDNDELDDVLTYQVFDLVLIDHGFDGGSGLLVLGNNYTRIIELLKIPTLIITSNKTENFIHEAFAHGVKNVIDERFLEAELPCHISSWIDHRSNENELRVELKILNEYKDAVDQSSIVSKTDAKGFITYVNDEFCKISGYTKDELIGKNHNIIRDSSTSKELYKELWHTIRELKQPWQGEIKNRSKDGTHYWVKSFIKPILDVDNNVVEYIAIRVDITQLRGED